MTVLATPLDEAAGTVLTACRASVGLIEVEATFGSLIARVSAFDSRALRRVNLHPGGVVNAPDPKKVMGHPKTKAEMTDSSQTTRRVLKGVLNHSPHFMIMYPGYK